MIQKSLAPKRMGSEIPNPEVLLVLKLNPLKNGGNTLATTDTSGD